MILRFGDGARGSAKVAECQGHRVGRTISVQAAANWLIVAVELGKVAYSAAIVFARGEQVFQRL